MNKKLAESTLKAVAKKEGVDIDAVRHEIDIAIASALENPDPKIQTFWSSVPCEGKKPTADEIIVYITSLYNNS